MKPEEFKDTFDGRAEYSEPCKQCNRTLRVRTQEDNCPEYYTTVHVECSCGDWTRFVLPVN